MARVAPSRPASAIGNEAVAAATSEPGVPSVRGGLQIPRTAVVLIAAITFLWGLNWPAMKVAVGEVSPWTFRVICVAISAPGLLGLAALAGERRLPARHLWPPLLLMSSLGITGWFLFSAFGLQHIEGGRGAIVSYTMPVWAALMSAVYLGERLDARRLSALALGMLGIAVLIGPDLVALGSSPLGPLLMTGAAICWAGGTVMLKSRDWSMGIVALTGWQVLIGGLPIVLIWLVLEPRPDLSRLTWQGGLGILYASTVALIFCMAAFNKVVTLLPATAAAISTLAIPVVGLLSSAWLLGEPAGWRELAALCLVLGGMALVLVPRRQARTS
jgi:drug/metabolite transporter (DMT)-like permease